MDYTYFKRSVERLKKVSLDTLSSHQKMNSRLIGGSSLEGFNSKKAAVLVLVYPKNNLATLVLIVRKTSMDIHSNQIALPGGKFEVEDLTLVQTALRETFEEIGVFQNKIEIVKPLTKLYIPVSNFEVFPYLSFSTEVLTFNPNPNEVSQIIELSIHDLLNENNVGDTLINNTYLQNKKVPAYHFGKHIVWGATAMILTEVKDLLIELTKT